jgi:hypothetical protein
MLVNWTDQGIKNMKDSVKRAEAFETAVEKVGNQKYKTFGHLQYLLLPQYQLLACRRRIYLQFYSSDSLSSLTIIFSYATFEIKKVIDGSYIL